MISRVNIKVVYLESDTFGNANFSKRLTKLAILPDYKCPGLLCLALLPCQKSGLIFVKKCFKNRSSQKIILTKNVLLNFYSSMENNQKDSNDFFTLNFNFGTSRQGVKAKAKRPRTLIIKEVG